MIPDGIRISITNQIANSVNTLKPELFLNKAIKNESENQKTTYRVASKNSVTSCAEKLIFNRNIPIRNNITTRVSTNKNRTNNLLHKNESFDFV